MNLGLPIVIPENIKKDYNCSAIGYVAHEVIDKSLNTFISVGLKDVTPNCYEPPVLSYGDIFFDAMCAFRDDKFEVCDELMAKCLDYELQLDKPIETNAFQKAEANIEYCFLHDKDNDIIKESNGNINLLNPSTGTVARFISTSLITQVDNIYILPKSPSDYIVKISEMLAPYNKKVTRIKKNSEIDKNIFYYLSFNGHLAYKYKLKKYVGFDLNYYQCVQNGLCDAMYYNNNGVSVTYHRKGVEITTAQSYGDTSTIRYASDVLIHKYRGTKQYNTSYSIIHDIVSSYTINFAVPILTGRICLTNCLVLIGNYHHKGKEIYNDKDEVIYINNGRNHSTYDLNKEWLPCDGEGVRLYEASYAINMFSGIAVFLGKKYKCKPSSQDAIIIYDGIKYACADDYSDIFVDHFEGKGKHIIDNKAVEKTYCVVQAVHLQQFFVDQKYSYGTYHDLVFDCYKLDDKLDIRTVINSLSATVTVRNEQEEFINQLLLKDKNEIKRRGKKKK